MSIPLVSGFTYLFCFTFRRITAIHSHILFNTYSSDCIQIVQTQARSLQSLCQAACSVRAVERPNLSVDRGAKTVEPEGEGGRGKGSAASRNSPRITQFLFLSFVFPLFLSLFLLLITQFLFLLLFPPPLSLSLFSTVSFSPFVFPLFFSLSYFFLSLSFFFFPPPFFSLLFPLLSFCSLTLSLFFFFFWGGANFWSGGKGATSLYVKTAT